MAANLRRRAAQLKERWPGYGPLLDFYVAVREAQAASKPRIRAGRWGAGARSPSERESPLVGDGGFPVDFASATTLFGTLCRLGKTANPHFAANAEKIERALADGIATLADLLASAARGEIDAEAAAERGLDARVLGFLLLNSVRPSVEAAAKRLVADLDPDSWRRCSCPVCDASPTLSLLKGDPVLRHSVCSRCGCEWRVDRVSCSACGNDDKDSLQYFQDEADRTCRIDVCDGCHRYIKTVDVRTLEASDPVLEDLATLHLDVIAADKGYTRVVPNPWNS